MKSNLIAPVKTQVAADWLGVAYHRLYGLARYGVIPWPEGRDSSGHMLWTEADLAAARRAIDALDARRRKSGAVPALAAIA
jgi:hypothetical protein